MADLPNWKEAWKTFTKAEARDILANRVQQQRPLKSPWVDALRRKIDLGLWEPYDPSQSAVAFDRNRNLINGQHRLNAFVASKADTLTTKIMTGCDPADYEKFDQEIKVRMKSQAHTDRSNVTRDQARLRHLMSLRMGDRHLVMTEAEFEFLASKTYRKELLWASEAIRIAANVGRAPFVAPFMYAYRVDPEFVGAAGTAWADGTNLPRAIQAIRDAALTGRALPRDGGGQAATMAASLKVLNALAVWHRKGAFPKAITSSMAGLRYFSEKLRDGAATTWEKQLISEESEAARVA